MLRPVDVRWMTAFIDRPAGTWDRTEAFWLAASGSTLSPRRGPQGQFATLVPADGDAYLRVQQVDDGPGGSHLDLHVGDVESATAEAVDLGALVVSARAGLSVMRSPAGQAWCIVRHHGESARPSPLVHPDASGTALVLQIDRLCIDVPLDRFDAECDFWVSLTGWTLDDVAVTAEHRRLVCPPEMPLGLQFQRREDSEGPARAHLDLSCSDRDRAVAHLVDLGATAGEAYQHLVVLHDPAGFPFCVTRRRPWSPTTGS